ncbi:hypothetical protein [Clostridium oryzae]|uniref:Uncharacterized protein n=1 Tax=Clostridium oryzae TaxID=1450648 RepID=A0A1V4I3H7_9CLOT|nr:hypothetical protein [Clostridium oryzae]OPJ54528.1 hypothetical protein CLORY_45830 [Clostridium oryzae]
MLAIKGYYDGKNFVPIGNIKIDKNKAAIITILDEYVEPNDILETKLRAIDRLNGILKNEPDDVISKFDTVLAKRMNISRKVDL